MDKQSPCNQRAEQQFSFEWFSSNRAEYFYANEDNLESTTTSLLLALSWLSEFYKVVVDCGVDINLYLGVEGKMQFPIVFLWNNFI